MGAPLPIATGPNGPLGHKGTRGFVLTQLKREQRLTAKQLATLLGTSLNAARHHLKELEAEGLVEYEREHRGVGAPAFAYRLTAAGEALFPRRYAETLTAVLDHLVARDGRETAVTMLEGYFVSLSRRLHDELQGSSPEERLRAVARTLSEEGYMAEVSGECGHGTVKEHNCAIPVVAQRFPEICAAEARFLAEVLEADVERREHILNGCSACEYHVRFKPAQERL
jgi:DeoR family suf operon transcriptional repressor